MLPSLDLVDTDAANWLLRGGDGSVRAALACWTVMLGAFVILRIPREVFLSCLLAAGGTVALAAMATPEGDAVPTRPSVIASPAPGSAAHLPPR